MLYLKERKRDRVQLPWDGVVYMEIQYQDLQSQTAHPKTTAFPSSPLFTVSYGDYIGQIKLMSITQLVSTIHIKDAITLTLNSQFLNHNFDVVRQCLLRIKDLEGHIATSDNSAASLQARVRSLEESVHSQSERLRISDEKVRELNANVGDDFMKKMYGIEAKTKNMFDFDETARRLQTLGCFVLNTQFEQQNGENKREFQRVWQLREELNRYLPNVAFEKYKLEQEGQLASKQKLIDESNQEMQRQAGLIDTLRDNIASVQLSVKQNNAMIGEINFPQLLQKLKKLKDETEGKVGQLAAKMKRKVGHGQLVALQTSMIQKLDKFLSENEHSKAQKQQTKAALMFLQRKINDIQDVVIHKASQEDKDALFSLKKWQCASCTKDLGKFEGKMGQYRPWSIFPCKQLDPEKSGGFGYLNYVDKMGYKKGNDGAEDAGLDRLSRTFYDSKEKQSPSKKLASTRGSNLINNYGLQEKGSSLKEVYFKDMQSQRKTSAPRMFRVTKKEGRAAEQPKEEVPQ